MPIEIAIKKPITVQFIRYDGDNLSELNDFTNQNILVHKDGEVEVWTGSEYAHFENGDYIIKDIQSNFYPCKKEVFSKTYDIIN